MVDHLRYGAGGHLLYSAGNGGHLAYTCGAVPCPDCAAGTTKKTLQVALPNALVNGTCTNCTALAGSTVILNQENGFPCRWTATVSPGNANCAFTLEAVFSAGTLTISLIVGGATQTQWQATSLGTNCAWSGLSVPGLSSFGAACVPFPTFDPLLVTAA